MRKTLFYTISWALVVMGIPLLGIAVIFDMLGFINLSSKIADNFLACLSWCMIRLTGSNVQIEGLEHISAVGPVVFISNHQGHFDSAVFLAYIRKPKAFVASSNAAKFPVFSTWFDLVHTTYLEKNNLRQNYLAMQNTEKIIDMGRSVVIYPEGIISSGPQLGEFKRGAFKLAIKSGVPIVPVVIDGSWKVMGEKKDKIQPATIIAKILPTVPTNGLSHEEQQELPDQIYNIIEKGLEDVGRATVSDIVSGQGAIVDL